LDKCNWIINSKVKLIVENPIKIDVLGT